MTTPSLHYVYDPLCGWCYAAEPLVQAAANAGVQIALHGGGLWNPAVHASDAKRRNMRDNDDRIGKLTGQVFGEAYLDGLLVNPESIWWSHPTIAAVLAAEAVTASKGLAMIAAIQRAHYVEGLPVVDETILTGAASLIGLDTGRFMNALRAAPVDAHIQKTRRLMLNHGLEGFPSFLIERKGKIEHLPHEVCYGRPEAFVLMIQEATPAKN